MSFLSNLWTNHNLQYVCTYVVIVPARSFTIYRFRTTSTDTNFEYASTILPKKQISFFNRKNHRIEKYSNILWVYKMVNFLKINNYYIKKLGTKPG